VLLAMAACGGGGDNFTGPPPPPPPNDEIATQRVFSQLSFTQPLAMIQLPNNDTRWYVVERAGIIRVFNNTPNVAQSDIFANLTARVNDTANEAGLLGLAFHPDFPNDQRVFVSYTGTSGGSLVSRISSFLSQDGGVTLNTASEQVLLSLVQTRSNHNGGQIAFGPDGFLYGGFGDGGGAGDPDGNGQDPTNLYGTIIRIDVDGNAPYEIPPNNPFAGNPQCLQGIGVVNCPEIFAWGFRNPWRWSFDSVNGNLWVGDVGQGDWEEIDRVTISMNYGWNVREGAHCFNPPSGCGTNFVDPITEYSHSLGNSVTGGYVYRGAGIPDLEGTYVYGDFGSGRIFGVPANSAQGTVGVELLDTTHSIASFAEDLDGELYVIDYGNGQLFQIVAAP
jgi:glucose/arabinose dehydrogenase